MSIALHTAAKIPNSYKDVQLHFLPVIKTTLRLGIHIIHPQPLGKSSRHHVLAAKRLDCGWLYRKAVRLNAAPRFGLDAPPHSQQTARKTHVNQMQEAHHSMYLPLPSKCRLATG